METRCKDEPNLTIERKINWAPDGKSMLACGFKAGTTEFGMVRWTHQEAVLGEPGRLVRKGGS